MAKAKRRHYKRYYKKGEWSTRLQNFNENVQTQANQTGTVAITYQLTENPAQTQDSVSQKFTVKNICIDCYLTLGAGQSTSNFLENFQYYVMYVPQGYPINVSSITDMPFNHPEWIMAYRYFNTPIGDSQTSFPPIRIRSRLARKLDTGDAIYLFAFGTYENTVQSLQVNLAGLVKYNTKAN